MIKYISEIKNNSNKIDYSEFINRMNEKNSNITSESTLSVRMSQMAFYMLGYKSNESFVPSVLTQKFMKNSIEKQQYGLLNLFSMQYPHPFSETSDEFCLYIGRFILKLLTDNRLKNKLYIDEIIWFLPFFKKITFESYTKLVKEILEYRKLSYDKKKNLFESVDNFDDVFSNVTHELNYYFIRVFVGFEVFESIGDREHNQGKLFKFKHGETETYRSDAYKSKKAYSGYVKISDKTYNDVLKLLDKYSPFESPSTQSNTISKEFWLKDLYEFNMIDYLSVIENIEYPDSIVKEMIHLSKFGSNDGKDFENIVKEAMDLFQDVVHTEIISGSGDTDILCVFQDNTEKFKFNVDPKKSKKTLAQINPARIDNHLGINGSKYALIVTSRFSQGANKDIRGYRIVNLEAESLGKYILKNHHNNGLISYSDINKIINDNLGHNISRRVEWITDSLFS